MIGSVSSRNGRVARSAGPRSRANGRRSPSVWPSSVPSGSTLASAVFVLRSASGSSRSVSRSAAILVGEGAEDGVVGVDEARQLVVLAAELLGQQAEVVHGPLDVARASASWRLSRTVLRPRGSKRRSVLDSSRPCPRTASPAPPSSSCSDARVSPSSADRNSSKFTFGSVLSTGIVKPSGASPAARRARIDLQHHVVEAGLRAQHRRGVAVERVVGVDLHRHDRAPVHEVDLRQLAHVDPGDLHRLALAGGDGLGGRHLRLVHGELRADARHPAGQRQTLLGEDVAAHDGGDQGERDDRDELLAVLADRAHHGRPPPRAVAAAAVAVEPWASDGPVRAVRSGLRCVWQATSVRRGGFVAGQAGRVPRGLAGRLP